MGGGKHALKKAISTIIETIQKVREVKVPSSSDPVGLRNGMDQGSGLTGENESRPFFLQSEVLSLWVEHVLVMSARD